tara:strand:+ start:97 stop:426 length:330 start_codon:yes stop_codon:yes gene_type:complete
MNKTSNANKPVSGLIKTPTPNKIIPEKIFSLFIKYIEIKNNAKALASDIPYKNTFLTLSDIRNRTNKNESGLYLSEFIKMQFTHRDKIVIHTTFQKSPKIICSRYKKYL